MVDFNLENPTEIEDPYDSKSLIDVWSQDRDKYERINLYFNEEEAPENLEQQLHWERQHAMNYVDFDATGAKVEETLTYVTDGFGGHSYYA